ncbi:MAG: CYTH domain-containing protein, partial [Lachnospiraceae bacterium]|nr:CYTH domain-containing protein [Lachnospiraceae bacterium]
MIEVECKLHIDDINAVESKLLELGFKQAGLVDEVDHYFDNDAGQIRGNDSALRIRTTKNIMTGEA